MAYAIERADGRWELRESASTDAGPRARSLLTFRVLTTEAARQAAHRARRPTSTAALVDRARQAGAPVAGSAADAAAATLLWELARGSRLSERLRRAVADRLGPVEALPGQARQAAPWSAATPAERGATLRDLLELGDRLPRRERPDAPRMPRLASR